MRLPIVAARALLEAVMLRAGHSAAESAIIADHLLDSELRGFVQGGVARAISVCERLRREPRSASSTRRR